jgi:hypothetical protein
MSLGFAKGLAHLDNTANAAARLLDFCQKLIGFCPNITLSEEGQDWKRRTWNIPDES